MHTVCRLSRLKEGDLSTSLGINGRIILKLNTRLVSTSNYVMIINTTHVYDFYYCKM